MSITPEDKDILLNYFIVNDSERLQFNFEDLSATLNLEPRKLRLIYKDFETRGLLSTKIWGRNLYHATTTIKLYDLHHMGGFIGVELVLLQNIDKLNLEIQFLQKQLGPNHLETVNKIASIGNSIAAIATLFK